MSSFVVAASLLATGASFTAVTVIVIVAVLDVNPPLSFTVYVTVAVPLKFKFGVNVTTPLAFTVNVPFAVVLLVWIPAVVGSKSTVATFIVPSTSVSLVVTDTVTGVSSFVVTASLFATGAQFGIGFIVTEFPVAVHVLSVVERTFNV